MTDHDAGNQVVPVTDLREFFRDALQGAIMNTDCDFSRTLSEIYAGDHSDIATLSVAARQIRSMTRTTGTGQSA